MRVYRLTNQERAGLDFTHQFVIEGKELTDADTSQTFDLLTITESTAVDNVVIVRVDERIGGPTENVSVEVGVPSDTDYHIVVSVVGGGGPAGTGLAGGTLYGSEHVTTSVGITDSNIYQCKFIVDGMMAPDLNTQANTGKISIFMKVISTSDLGFDQS
jgi:hypothetical protein